MAFAPIAPSYITLAEHAVSSLWGKVTEMFGSSPKHEGLTPEQALLMATNIDPHFIPRAPMSNANLDVFLLNELGKMGYKRGKEITAATHPQYYSAWVELCRRGGLEHVPQLVLVESKSINAGMMSGEEAGFVTTGLLKRLNFREAIAVQSHEVGHEASNHTSPRGLAMLLFGGSGLILGNKFAARGGFGSMIKTVENPGPLRRFGHWLFGNGKEQSSVLASEVYMGLGTFLGTVAGKQFSIHPTELDADRKGAMISGDPEGLIAALSKLEDPSAKRGFWGTVGHYFHFITSGYPATENRIKKLHHIAQSMPRDAKPVYTMFESAALPTQPVIAATTPAQSLAPSAQITSVSQPERVAASQVAAVAQ